MNVKTCPCRPVYAGPHTGGKSARAVRRLIVTGS